MICEKCGKALTETASLCTFCGCKTKNLQVKKQKALNTLTIVFLIFLYPVGVMLMLSKTSWKNQTKILISAIATFVFIISLVSKVNDIPDPNLQIDNTQEFLQDRRPLRRDRSREWISAGKRADRSERRRLCQNCRRERATDRAIPRA